MHAKNIKNNSFEVLMTVQPKQKYTACILQLFHSTD
jgi:hypothetical protein